MNDDSLLHAIMPQYAFRVYEWTWLTTDQCRLHTDAGRKMLVISSDVLQTEARGRLLDELARHHYRRTPRYIRSIYGDPWVSYRSHICTVADDLAWKPVTVRDSDLQEAAENLAVFHAALAEVAYIPELDTARTLVSVRMREGMATLDRIGKECSREPQTPFARRYLNEAPRLMERARRAYTTACSAGLLEREQQARTGGAMALGCYDLDAIARTDLDHIATLRFDSMTRGDPEFDLYDFCAAVFRRGRAELIPHLLEAYGKVAQEVSPITEDSARFGRRKRVIGYLGFPFPVLEVGERYLQSDAKGNDVWRESLDEALWHLSGQSSVTVRGQDSRGEARVPDHPGRF